MTLRGEQAPRLTWIVAAQQEGEFTLKLSDPAPDDLCFTYWIGNTYGVDGPSSEHAHEASPEPSAQEGPSPEQSIPVSTPADNDQASSTPAQ